MPHPSAQIPSSTWEFQPKLFELSDLRKNLGEIGVAVFLGIVSIAAFLSAVSTEESEAPATPDLIYAALACVGFLALVIVGGTTIYLRSVWRRNKMKLKVCDDGALLLSLGIPSIRIPRSAIQQVVWDPKEKKFGLSLDRGQMELDANLTEYLDHGRRRCGRDVVIHSIAIGGRHQVAAFKQWLDAHFGTDLLIGPVDIEPGARPSIRTTS